MNRTARAVATAMLLLATITGCGGGGEQDPAAENTAPAAGESQTGEDTVEMVAVETEVATLARPQDWSPVEGDLQQDRVAAFTIADEAGATVGQMDVLVNAVPPGTKADAVDAANQGARATSFKDLRHVRREFAEVPGAASAFLNESTYLTAEGEQARSLDLVAIAEDGGYLLVRISSADSAYDAALFERVLDSVEMTEEATS